jgi:hypothetical protein
MQMIVLLVAAGLLLAACSGAATISASISSQGSSGGSSPDAPSGPEGAQTKSYIGKVTAANGNEITVLLAKTPEGREFGQGMRPDGSGEASASGEVQSRPEGASGSGPQGRTERTQGGSRPEGGSQSGGGGAMGPGGRGQDQSASGSMSMELEYTEESKTFLIPVGTPVYTAMSRETAVDFNSITVGKVIQIQVELSGDNETITTVNLMS